MAIGSDINIVNTFNFKDGDDAINNNSLYSVYEDDFYYGSTTLLHYMWTNGSSDSTIALGTNYSGGIMSMKAPNLNSYGNVYLAQKACLIAQNPIFNTRLWIQQITSQQVTIGWNYVTGNDYCHFVFDTAVDANNIYIASNNNGAGEVITDTGVNLVANTRYYFKIQLKSDGSYLAYINDVLVKTGSASSVREGVFWYPKYYIKNLVGGSDKYMFVDWMRLIQDRY